MQTLRYILLFALIISFSPSLISQADLCTEKINLSLGKETQQSSTKASGNSSLAVDGILTGGDPWKGEIQHTQNEAQPWWQVDLGQVSQVSEIHLFNRTNCCQDRLRDFVILLSESAFPANASLDQLLATPSIEAIPYDGEGQPTYIFPMETKARFVRVQLRGQRSLHMAEVAVLGCIPNDNEAPITPEEPTPPVEESPTPDCQGSTNLAFGKTSQQSSTKASGDPSLAVDGILTGGDPWKGEIQHTQNQAQPWWQVDLGQVSQLSEILIYNRTNCCQERLQNFVVLLSAQAFPANASLRSTACQPGY